MRLKRNFCWIITQKFRLTVGGHSPSACMPLIFTTPKVKTHKNNRLLIPRWIVVFTFNYHSFAVTSNDG